MRRLTNRFARHVSSTLLLERADPKIERHQISKSHAEIDRRIGLEDRRGTRPARTEPPFGTLVCLRQAKKLPIVLASICRGCVVTSVSAEQPDIAFFTYAHVQISIGTVLSLSFDR
jgi:hypothetical protein